MNTKASVEQFLTQKTLAIVGISRSNEKFGNMAFKELKAKGYKVIPIHPVMESFEGERCYPNLSALPEPVGGLLAVTPPAQTEKLVKEALEIGIRNIWLQQGAESTEAVEYCREHGANVVSGECIMMFAQPVGFGHNIHRWVWGLLGKLPK